MLSNEAKISYIIFVAFFEIQMKTINTDKKTFSVFLVFSCFTKYNRSYKLILITYLYDESYFLESQTADVAPSPPQQQVPIVVDVEQAAFFHRAVGKPVAVRLTPPIQP